MKKGENRLKYNQENFNIAPTETKLAVVKRELELATHNGTTKDDLILLLSYCYNRCANADGDTSDGYHTFNELYEYRKVFNALLFNEWAKQGKYDICKSKVHSDGELCFGGGWFIVVAQLPTGQISNHYKLQDWHLFKVEEKMPNEYDGHTPSDVLERMKLFLTCKKRKD